MTTDIATMERIEKQKRDAIHSEVVVKNKANNFHLENTKNLMRLGTYSNLVVGLITLLSLICLSLNI